MIEVHLKTEPLLVIKALERIGIRSSRTIPVFDEKTGQVGRMKRMSVITPTAYLYINRREQKAYLIHFKEWFLISKPGAYNDVQRPDTERLRFIAGLLSKWGLIDCDPSLVSPECTNLTVVDEQEIGGWLVNHKVNRDVILCWGRENEGQDSKDVEPFRVTIDQFVEKL